MSKRADSKTYSFEVINFLEKIPPGPQTIVNSCCGNGGKILSFLCKDYFFPPDRSLLLCTCQAAGTRKRVDIDRANSLYFYLLLATLPRSKRIGKNRRKIKTGASSSLRAGRKEHANSLGLGRKCMQEGSKIVMHAM